jgi:hypothetical protein
MNVPPYSIFVFWTGTNSMSPARNNCLQELKRVSCANVILITPANLDQYILPSEPLHRAYECLSETHRSDYLRAYFMNFYGGGYCDIKRTQGSWLESFDKLNNSDRWMLGYKEIKHNGNQSGWMKDIWEESIGCGAFICKPHTPLTEEWYSKVLQVMDDKMEELTVFPASYPQDCREFGNHGYPLGWNDLLGEIFPKCNYKYRDKVFNTLPMIELNNYR